MQYLKGLFIGLLFVVPWVLEAVLFSQYIRHPQAYLILLICGSVETLLAIPSTIICNGAACWCVDGCKSNTHSLGGRKVLYGPFILAPWVFTNIFLLLCMRPIIEVEWYTHLLCYMPIIISLPIYASMCSNAPNSRIYRKVTFLPSMDVMPHHVGINVGICVALAIAPWVIEAIFVVSNSKSVTSQYVVSVIGYAQAIVVIALFSRLWSADPNTRCYGGTFMCMILPWVIANTVMLFVLRIENEVPWYAYLGCFAPYLAVPPGWMAGLYAYESNIAYEPIEDTIVQSAV